MGALREDNDALRARLAEALAVLTREAGALGVPAGRLAAFGFCFGGACVLELARSGADLRAFVSFHGLLDTPRPAAGPSTYMYSEYLSTHAPHPPPTILAGPLGVPGRQSSAY